jgi:hypothetical protein
MYPIRLDTCQLEKLYSSYGFEINKDYKDGDCLCCKKVGARRSRRSINPYFIEEVVDCTDENQMQRSIWPK